MWFFRGWGQPWFWRDIGGWPLWLRDLVWLLFYPALMLEIAFLLTLSAGVARRLSQRCPCYCHPGAALVLWLVVMILVVWNNVENRLYGRPLHWHEG